jgi:hypothetical protein
VILERLTVDQEAYQAHQDQPLILADGTLNPAITDILLKPEGKKSMTWKDFENGYMKK